MESPDDPAADWHARLCRLYEYWRGIHPATGLPGRQHFDPLAVPDLLPSLWMVDVAGPPLRFRYRLVGTAIVGALGREFTGQWLDESHQGFRGSRLERDYRSIVNERRPHHRKDPSRLLQLNGHALLESLMLPLARDGANVDIILGCMVFLRADGTEVFR